MYVPNLELLNEEMREMNDEELGALYFDTVEKLENVEDVNLAERASYFLAMSQLSSVVKSEMLRRGFQFLNC